MTRRRRPAIQPPGGTVPMALAYAVTTSGDTAELAQARRDTHDKLVADLAWRRVGPVEWSMVAPHEVAATLDTIETTDRPAGVGADGVLYDELRAHAAEHPDGWLVVAMCPALLLPADG